MFEEYKEEVLKSYKFKKEKDELSSNLANPGRLKLKRECLKVFAERYSKEDDQMLKSFFDPLSKFNDHIRSIEKFELDKFRPLITFLERGRGIRNDEPIKLLAWLIGFDTYQDWKLKGGKKQSEGPITDPPNDDENRISWRSIILRFLQDIPGIIIKRPLSVKNTVIIYIVILLTGGGIFYLSVESTSSMISQSSADKKCMYWTGDHYEPVKCDAKIKGVALIPINLQTLNNLRRIKVKDTLTKYSLGKVWYSKIYGKNEFFTDSGMNPVDTLKRLRPLSTHMLNNYVSYHRYLLTRLTWSACAIITTLLCVIYMICFFRKQKKFRT